MNIPTRVLKSTFITYDTYIQHQQLAKRFYKSNKALKKTTKAMDQTETSKNFSENEHVSLAIGEFKHSFKEDLMKWYIYFLKNPISLKVFFFEFTRKNQSRSNREQMVLNYGPSHVFQV
jgi:hypothetical protein